jgi:hypothetical protein
MESKNDQTKNVNNKVDILYNSWLGMRDDYRTLIGVEDTKIVKNYDDDNDEW